VVQQFPVKIDMGSEINVQAQEHFTKLSSGRPKVTKYHEKIAFKASSMTMEADKMQMQALRTTAPYPPV